MRRRFELSKESRWIMGVAGGMSDYFDMDLTVIRFLWIFATCMFPPIVVIYIIIAIFTPTEK